MFAFPGVITPQRTRGTSSALDLKKFHTPNKLPSTLDHRHISEEHSSLGGEEVLGMSPKKPRKEITSVVSQI